MNHLTIERTQREKIENFMNDECLQYFSCTVFDKNYSEIASICSNKDWDEFYQKIYLPNPPVKKYIIQSRRGLLWWDADLFDKNTAHYIANRNDVCSTSMICTFVPEGKSSAAAISFGSKLGQKHLINLIEARPDQIKEIFNMFVI